MNSPKETNLLKGVKARHKSKPSKEFRKRIKKKVEVEEKQAEIDPREWVKLHLQPNPKDSKKALKANRKKKKQY